MSAACRLLNVKSLQRRRRKCREEGKTKCRIYYKQMKSIYFIITTLFIDRISSQFTFEFGTKQTKIYLQCSEYTIYCILFVSHSMKLNHSAACNCKCKKKRRENNKNNILCIESQRQYRQIDRQIPSTYTIRAVHFFCISCHCHSEFHLLTNKIDRHIWYIVLYNNNGMVFLIPKINFGSLCRLALENKFLL